MGNRGLAIVQITKAIRAQARIQKKIQSITLSLFVLVLVIRDYVLKRYEVRQGSFAWGDCVEV